MPYVTIEKKEGTQKMKVIRDASKIQKLILTEKLDNYFDTGKLSFEIHQFEKGEIIASPSSLLESILFLVDGTIQNYGILNNGGKLSISLMEKPALLGDIEFCGHNKSFLFSEAMTRVTCLALPFQNNKKYLDQDVRFLHMLLHSLTGKMLQNSQNEVETPTLEERVLFYLEHVLEDHQLHGIEKNVIRLQCSRRQLQRVLKKLCEEGKVIKAGKGTYRLNPELPH